jgi:hypothetical protein
MTTSSSTGAQLGQVRAQVAAPKSEEQDQAKELRVMLRLVGRCSRFRSVSPPAVSNAPATSPIYHLLDKLEAKGLIVEARAQGSKGPNRFVELIFDYNISLLQAERTWLLNAITRMQTMDKVDLKKKYKTLYSPSAKDFSLVDVPRLNYLMVDGEGNPNIAESYKQAVEALYAVSYAIKFASKKQLGRDYGVMPLEGLWTADDPSAFTRRAKDKWKWTMMIMQPDWIAQEMVDEAIQAVRAKKNPAALDLLRFESYEEGRSVQIMHIGSYDDETPTLARLHDEFMPEHELAFNGPHHEIYIGDPRKAAPSKLKTVLRQPVK